VVKKKVSRAKKKVVKKAVKKKLLKKKVFRDTVEGARRYGRSQTEFSRACKRALAIAAVKNEFFTSTAVRFHLNGATPEANSLRSSVMAGAFRSAKHDGLIEQTDRLMWLKQPGSARTVRESVWHSLCHSPGTDDEEEDED